MQNLRPMRPSDIVAVHALVLETIEACYPAAYPPRAVEFFKAYHSIENIQADAAEGVTLVFEDDGIRGTGTLLKGGIKRVFVSPHMQGLGLGRLLMSSLEAEAARAGLQEVTLDASLVSIDFYRHLGYREVSEGEHDVGAGQVLRYLVMCRAL